MNPTDVRWMVAVSLLGAGFVLATAVLWRLRRSGPRGVSPQTTQSAELRARFEVLLGQLQELDAGDSSRAPEVVAEERQALEQAAAQVVLELATREAPSPAAEGAAPVLLPGVSEASSRRVRHRVLLCAAGGAVCAGLLAFSVAQAARTRATDDVATPLSTVAGPVDPTASASTHPTADETAARSALERNPEDVEARLELARLRLDQQDYMAVWSETQEVLRRSAGHPKALTYQSQVRLAMGQPDVALTMLKEALTKDPGFLQAHVYLSYVYLRLGQTGDAENTITEAKRRFPGEDAMLEGGFMQMKASLASDAPMKAGEGNPHAGLGIPPHGAIGPNPHAGMNPHAEAAPRAGQRPIAPPSPGARDEVFLGKEELRLVLERK